MPKRVPNQDCDDARNKLSVHIESSIPWDQTALFRDTVGRSRVNYDNIGNTDFPKSFGEIKRQLPEDSLVQDLMVLSCYKRSSRAHDECTFAGLLKSSGNDNIPLSENCIMDIFVNYACVVDVRWTLDLATSILSIFGSRNFALWSRNFALWSRNFALWSRNFALWSSTLSFSYLPAVFAAAVIPGKSKSAQTSKSYETSSLMWDWTIPFIVLALIIGGDLLVDKCRYRKSSKIFNTSNVRAKTFWSTFYPPAAAAMISIDDENGARRLVFMFLLGCAVNQFRKCIHDFISGPEAFILMAALWTPWQYLLLEYVVHDAATQRTARWMMASFAITIVTRLSALSKRIWGSDSPSNYNNTHRDYHRSEQV